MDERCFRPLLCTVKAELGRGQPGTMARGNKNTSRESTKLKWFKVKLGNSFVIKLLQGGPLKSLRFGAMLK